MRKLRKKEAKLLRMQGDWEMKLTQTQLEGVEAADKILTTILHVGLKDADFEYQEELCYEGELLSDYKIPNILRETRYLLDVITYYTVNPNRLDELEKRLQSLYTIVSEANKHLQDRIEKEEEQTTTTPIEALIGYFWKTGNLLKYNLYENDAEILQLSFKTIYERERKRFEDLGYWFNLKSGQIHYTRKLRADKTLKHVKADDTEFDVFQAKQLFVYPGYFNKRIRWQKGEIQQRATTTEDLALVLKYAESDYQTLIKNLKESFAEPLADRTPVFLVKLHKTFINGENLVLEDEHGAYLTISSEKEEATTLLRTILPSQLSDAALLVQLNDDTDNEYISLSPLSLITSKKIIRLSF